MISTQIVALERHDACLPHRRLELGPVPGLDAKGLALVVVQLDARRRRPPEDVPALGHAREARQADALEGDVYHGYSMRERAPAFLKALAEACGCSGV